MTADLAGLGNRTVNGSHFGLERCGVPASADAVELNLVAVTALAGGNPRIDATGVTPSGGVLNFANLTPNMNNSNAVVVPLNASGEMDLFTNTGANDGTPTVHARGIILGFYN